MYCVVLLVMSVTVSTWMSIASIQPALRPHIVLERATELLSYASSREYNIDASCIGPSIEYVSRATR